MVGFRGRFALGQRGEWSVMHPIIARVVAVIVEARLQVRLRGRKLRHQDQRPTDHQ